jgi:hypothetical protein
MTTASVSSVIANASSANFQAWVQEIYTNLVTNCGLCQLPAGMDSGQMAVPCATAWANTTQTSLGYYQFSFNDTLSQGPLVTGTALSLGSTGAQGAVTAAATTGSGYTTGGAATVTNVALSYVASGGLGGTGGTGSGAIGTVVINSSGIITSITPTTAGTGYLVGDQLTVTNGALAAGSKSGAGTLTGTGSGAIAYVQLLTSAAAPVVLKWEFGTGAASANPNMWATMGTSWTISSSNGQVAAVSNGAATTRVAITAASGALVSTTIPYISRYCYNKTYGFLGFAWKSGAQTSGSSYGYGGLFIFRTGDGNGNPTANAAVLLTGGIATATAGTGYGVMQCMSYTNNAIYPTLSAQSSISWLAGTNYTAGSVNSLFGLASTYENGTVFVMPAFTMDPVLRFSPYICAASLNDVPLGISFSAAIIGATALTFLSLGQPFGSANLCSSQTQAWNSLCMLWM